MKIRCFHPWNVTPQEALVIQEHMRGAVITRGRGSRPTLIAGADAAFDLEKNHVYAAVVVLSFPALEVVETVIHRTRLRFPYIPDLLSFRESPALLGAFERLRMLPT